jgi:hypothetical protein
MYQKLYQLAGDAQAMADQIRALIPGCSDYDLARLLKKLDAEMMDTLHNIQLALRLCRENDSAG